MESFHLTDDDLERYLLGKVSDDIERVILEEHLICCPDCADEAVALQHYIDSIRLALLGTPSNRSVPRHNAPIRHRQPSPDDSIPGL
jgi:anti-sigma factor RsiW